MAHEPDSDPEAQDEQEDRVDLEELLPGRNALLRELSRSLKEASPAWADALLREAELMLMPGRSSGMHRYRTQCEAECGVTLYARRDGARLPPRDGGPGTIEEIRRCLAITHPEKAEEMLGQLLSMSMLPVPWADAPDPDAVMPGDPEPLGSLAPLAESVERVRCPGCGKTATLHSEFYCPPCGMG